MRSRRLAVGLVAIVLSVGVGGCGQVEGTGEILSEAVEPTGQDSVTVVDPPDAALADDPVVAEAARSVVKIHAVAESCQKILEGSGVVIAPNRVMSAAHAVAGANSVSVLVGDEDRPATVVSFDPNMDIAVLDVPGLQAPPLDLADKPAATGTDALALGYPGGGPFTATPVRIREIIQLEGPDIYRTTTVNRQVYVVRGAIRQGDSGGPLIGLDRRVLGISFGAGVDDPDTGFVLTAEQIFGLLVDGVGATQPVATGACVS